jgi:hypothetical protein
MLQLATGSLFDSYHVGKRPAVQRSRRTGTVHSAGGRQPVGGDEFGLLPDGYGTMVRKPWRQRTSCRPLSHFGATSGG